MPRSFRAASPLKRVSLLLRVLRVVEELGVYGYDAALARASPCRRPTARWSSDPANASPYDPTRYEPVLEGVGTPCWIDRSTHRPLRRRFALARPATRSSG